MKVVRTNNKSTFRTVLYVILSIINIAVILLPCQPELVVYGILFAIIFALPWVIIRYTSISLSERIADGCIFFMYLLTLTILPILWYLNMFHGNENTFIDGCKMSMLFSVPLGICAYEALKQSNSDIPPHRAVYLTLFAILGTNGFGALISWLADVKGDNFFLSMIWLLLIIGAPLIIAGTAYFYYDREPPFGRPSL